MTSQPISVIDYGVGNLLSVQRGFDNCGAEVKFISTPAEILTAEKLVLISTNPDLGCIKIFLQGGAHKSKRGAPVRCSRSFGNPLKCVNASYNRPPQKK